MRALENKKRETNMGGHYNKEINNFQRGRSNLDRLNRQNQAFQQKNEQRRKAINARAEIIANSKIDNGVSAFGVETFDPKMQAYVQDLEQKYGLTSAESFPQLTEAVIPASLFEEIPETVNTFIKKADFAPALVKKVQTVVEKAAPQGEKSTSTWASNLVRELKAANITVTETFMDRLMDFLGNNKVLRPLTAAMVMMTLALTSCKPIEAGNTNEPQAAETAQIPAEEEGTAVSTNIAPTEESTQAADPGDEENAKATEEAKLSADQLENEINQAGEAANIKVVTSSSFAEELYKLDYISPSTDKDILINESTARPYVRLNLASPYGPAGTLITEGIGGGVLFISGEANNLSDVRIEGAYIAMGTAENGSTWVVDAKTGNWVPQAEGHAETAVAEVKISAEDKAAYTATIERYMPGENVDQIINMIPEAQAILAGGEYNESLSNEERQTLAFAIVAELETQRGVQPLSFEDGGNTYFYNPEQTDILNRWQQSPDNEATQERSTLQLYIPIYKNAETGNIMYYWQGSWSEAQGSGEIDYSHFVNKDNMDDGTIDLSTELFLRQITEQLNIHYIPAICLDDESDEIEVFPFNRKVGDVEGITYFAIFDFLMIDQNNLYGTNIKLVSNGQNVIIAPGERKTTTFASTGHIVEEYDGVFEYGNTYYIAIQPNFEESMQSTNYAQSIVSNYGTIDGIVNGNSYIDETRNNSVILLDPLGIYNPD